MLIKIKYVPLWVNVILDFVPYDRYIFDIILKFSIKMQLMPYFLLKNSDI